ncbi:MULTISPECIES: acyl-CoA dehydrogenase family protein [unclassified Mycobacterium]|uniref:acyl-CoA dehydrogenase family protein n=1 Tax=unclassified Mycobacterium TaxID=2642494 RepID=UPI0007FC6532|nr:MULTISPECIES: acyl-CoA dehydrogenase family protein [unclassified Mycobacterium]OBI15866.1 acyl-CoA dehydrogenase [Mycobacterium sp. E2497]
MDVGLNADQLSLRDTVRDILRTECPADAARQAITDPERWRALWKTVVDLGWTELAEAGDYGPVELAVVLEECGAALAPIPLLSSVGLAAGALRHTGLEAVVDDIAGGAIATLAVHARGSRLAGAPMTLHGGRLRGRAVAVPNLSRADLLVTLARADTVSSGTVVAAVRCGDGVTVIAGESTDPAQPLADVEVDAEPVATAPVDVDAALTPPLVAAAADLVGVARAALHRAVEHAKTRRQFGTPIGAFQAIKHALADNYVGLERARSLTYAAAARLAGPTASPTAAWTGAALAKAAAGEAAVNCARTAVQVHGALGQTWEHDAHLYVRHAWQTAAMLGDSRALYHEVGRRFAGSAK